MRNFIWLLFCAFFSSLLAPHIWAASGELPRAGAPRPLRLIGSDGTPLTGLPSDVAWENGGVGVFFTLERGGTRNIWRAFPDPQDDSRFPAWRALPVTDLRAPRYAAQPCPTPGNRALVCVSNVLTNQTQTSHAQIARIAQIVRYDFKSLQWTALSDGVRLYDSPHVSPDGARVAFAGGQGAQTRVFIASTANTNQRAMPDVTPVVNQARSPVWLGNEALLMESLVPQARGLYWVPLSSTKPQLVVGGGGEANVLGENSLVFSAKTALDAAPSLYLIARDGSGLRALSETQNARRPAVSSDGTTLAYDAPRNGSRALWVVPLLRVESQTLAPDSTRAHLVADDAPQPDAPTAQLTLARPASEGVAIIGILRGANNSIVKLEVGAGEKPRFWETLDATFPPTSPLLNAQGNRVLAFWNPPARAKGVWTLRLSLSGLGGGAQSLLRVRLPLPLDAPSPTRPNTEATRPESSAIGTPYRVTPAPSASEAGAPDDVPAPPPLPSILGAPDDQNGLPFFPPIQAPAPIPPAPIPPAPIPPVNVAPAPIPPIRVGPPNAPITMPMPIMPTPTTSIEPFRISPVNKVPATPPAVLPNELADTPTALGVAAADATTDDDNYGDLPPATGDPFLSQFNVSGTPARMAPREKIKVTFWGANRGSATWNTGGDGANRVRVVARWVDFSTGTRRQWNFFWLRDAVAPGKRTHWDFDLTAPARPGKYKLIYGLVHLPASGEFNAPAYSAPQETWDGEFGAIAFAVEVAPKGS